MSSETNSPLLDLQALLSRLNDAAVQPRVTDYLIQDAGQCGELMGRTLHASEDEQVLINDSNTDAALTVYIDERVTAHLKEHDPLFNLCDNNLEDFCTAVEGVSHFQYLVWSLTHGRQVSMLELELQAEVDKYALATCLLMQQHSGFQPALHRRLFKDVAYVPTLEAAVRERYQEANRLAAHFCRRNDERYLNCRQPRMERWLNSLRELFRCGHQEKFRRALC